MVSAAFDCSASLPACWLGLMGLGVAPAVHACGLLLAQRLSRRRQHQPGDAPKEDATSESKLDGRGSTSSQQPLLPAADEQQWCGVVKEGAWRGLFLREAQVVLHIGFQLFMLLPLLGALVAPSSTGRAGDYWWWHILVG